MSEDQCLAVLRAIDESYEGKLLKNGRGETLGYAYSKRIFVVMYQSESPLCL